MGLTALLLESNFAIESIRLYYAEVSPSAFSSRVGPHSNRLRLEAMNRSTYCGDEAWTSMFVGQFSTLLSRIDYRRELI
jgi:hypothetical protein